MAAILSNLLKPLSALDNMELFRCAGRR